jgi:hypothetical protein
LKLSRGARQLGRQSILLAPSQSAASRFVQASVDPSRHHRLLAEAQRLRGRVYVQDGAIQPSELSGDDRHIQAADDHAWHLLTVDENEAVIGCIRYFAHEPSVRFSELSLAESGITRSAQLGTRVRAAVETELDCARRRGVWYVELGGWAVCESLRCTTEAVRTLLTVYALSQVRGGAVGLSSATTRHHSSSILRRIGGRPLKAHGVEVPSYYDATYACEMELLSFDSESPNERYAGWIRDCREGLHQVPVVLGAPENTCASDLLRLHAAVGGHPEHVIGQAELAENETIDPSVRSHIKFESAGIGGCYTGQNCSR